MDTHTYGGSCHCGRVRFEVTTNLSRASQCNCSICTIWPDIRLSLLEITGGIVVSGLIGFLIVEGLFKKKFSNRIRALLCLTAVAPVVLASQIMFWVGIGIWQKILTITCFMCFPFMQALSSYRNLTLLNRLLTALDEAMPYAFVGMVFAEAMAATAGLGFLMIIAGS